MLHEGRTYLAAVMDLCGRRIVGWATSKRIDTALVSEALHNALRERQPGPGLMHLSDRGSQYASNEYREALELCDITCNMSRDDARTGIFEYIETFYNTKRRHATLGYTTPAQYESELKHHEKLAA